MESKTVYIADYDHYTKVLEKVGKVKGNLWVATADIKEMDTDTGLVPVKISVANLTAGRDYQTAEAVPNNLRIRVEKSGKKVLSLTATNCSRHTDGPLKGRHAPAL